MSKSRILCYQNCPHRFRKLYIEKWRPQKEPKQLKEGSEKHEIFEKAIKKAKKVKDKSKVKEFVQKDPNYQKYKNDCDNFVKFQEKKKMLPLYEEVECFDPDLNIIGIIDRVDMTEQGLVVIDYKTGKASNDINKYRFELALYTYLFEKLHNQTVTKWGIYFSKEDKIVTQKRSQDAINHAIKYVGEIRQAIKNSEKTDTWDKKPSKLCFWCELFKSGVCHGQEGWLFGQHKGEGNKDLAER